MIQKHDTEHRIQDIEYMIQKRIQDTGDDTGYRIQKHDTEHRIQNTEYRTLEQNTGCRTLDTRWLD